MAADFSLYIVECSDGTLYTGVAADVQRRLREHTESRRGAKYLRSRGPLTLRFEQAVGDRSTALRLEARVKKLARADKKRLIDRQLDLESLLEA